MEEKITHLTEEGLNHFMQRLLQGYLNQINQNKEEITSLQDRVNTLESKVQTLEEKASS